MGQEITGRPLEILLVVGNPGDVRLTTEMLKQAKLLNRLTVAVDGFASHGWTLTVLEEGAELMAIAFFVAGFAQRYRDAAAASETQVRATTEITALPRAELQKAA